MMPQCSLQVYTEKLKSVCTKTCEVFTARLSLIVVWTPGSQVWPYLGDRMPLRSVEDGAALRPQTRKWEVSKRPHRVRNAQEPIYRDRK